MGQPTNHNDLAERDAQHVWHPYGGFPATTTPLIVTGASGAHLTLDDGHTLIDGMSSWWAAIHGYRHPHLDAAAHQQVDTISHVMFGGLTHQPAIELATRLAAMSPGNLDKVFLADSGSVSIEVAAKMAIQYQRARGHNQRVKLATWRGGYHGDTFTPMSVCDPVGGMHSLWSGLLPTQIFAPTPPAHWDDHYAEQLRHMVRTHAHDIAAVIVEPVVQGAGGMRFHDPAYLNVLREACDDTGVLFILDEIATAFGRTGALFAANHANIAPDILCVGKALTGGYLTLAATLTTTDIAETISAGEAGGIAHGPTFMGNPLACSIANASLDLVDQGTWRDRVPQIAERLRAGLEPARELPHVHDVRVLGAIGVVQLDRPVDMQTVTDAVTGEGVWLRPFRDMIYTMPPLVCSDDEIDAICHAMLAGARAMINTGAEQ